MNDAICHHQFRAEDCIHCHRERVAELEANGSPALTVALHALARARADLTLEKAASQGLRIVLAHKDEQLATLQAAARTLVQRWNDGTMNNPQAATIVVAELNAAAAATRS